MLKKLASSDSSVVSSNSASVDPEVKTAVMSSKCTTAVIVFCLQVAPLRAHPVFCQLCAPATF
jgi:hypothetical protein